MSPSIKFANAHLPRDDNSSQFSDEMNFRADDSADNDFFTSTAEIALSMLEAPPRGDKNASAGFRKALTFLNWEVRYLLRLELAKALPTGEDVPRRIIDSAALSFMIKVFNLMDGTNQLLVCMSSV